ncbi:unnamed protein product, partial [Musa textilis]
VVLVFSSLALISGFEEIRSGSSSCCDLLIPILIMASPPEVPTKDSDMQISDPPRSKKEYFHP